MYILFKYLMKSILRKGKTNITIWKYQYHVDGLHSGKLLLKVIIRQIHLDTNTTISIICTKLSSLGTYILLMGGYITEFKTYVKVLTESLEDKGDTPTELLNNVLKGYLSV